MIPDNSVDFAISWDSLVHVEHETVRGTCARSRPSSEARRDRVHPTTELRHAVRHDRHELDKHVLGGRRPSMTAEKFRPDCGRFGLRCLSQELVPWTEPGLLIDSFSLFMPARGRGSLAAGPSRP